MDIPSLLSHFISIKREVGGWVGGLDKLMVVFFFGSKKPMVARYMFLDT